MKILNIYGQYDNHTEAKIVGNRTGLLELRDVINKALKDGTAISGNDDPLFASDGEGYEIIVELHNDSWGIIEGTGKEDPASFWSKEESSPQYISQEIQKSNVESQ